ncbi:Hypothetical predicted protein [Pelobates cultripes]|uniref:Uncharacterized protein n=1 Tax=Pelobates cultripes TaxID=61616 RepID=A0AAD1RYF1_PELCU|nr:Hypothetical predicted protein [Pelobates cultripes]
MSKKDVAYFWIVLLLCQELRTDPIAEMGPSSGILIQETPGFILTEKRILTRRVFVSLDPKISIEKAYNISSMQLHELQTWYQMHLQRAHRNILEQARKPFVSSTISMSNRPKRFLTAIIVALFCTTVSAVVATGMSAANSITVQKLDMEIYALKQHINDIHQDGRLVFPVTSGNIRSYLNICTVCGSWSPRQSNTLCPGDHRLVSAAGIYFGTLCSYLYPRLLQRGASSYVGLK